MASSVCTNKHYPNRSKKGTLTSTKVTPPVPKPATLTCGNCSEYVLQLLALSSEKCVRDDELQVLRAAQHECSSMASDIQRLYACIEEQRQHIVKLSSSSSSAVADPGVGIFSLLNELSLKHGAETAAVMCHYQTQDAQRESAVNALRIQVGELSAEVSHARSLEAAAVAQCNEVSRCFQAARADVAAAGAKHAEQESIIALLNDTVGVSRREIEAQYRCITEQQRHFNAYVQGGETASVPDEHVGLYALVSDVKHNEFEFYRAKLDGLRAQMHASTSVEVQKSHAILSRHLEFRYAEAIRSSWSECVASQQACSALKVELDAARTELDATRTELEATRTELEGARTELEGARTELEAVRVQVAASLPASTTVTSMNPTREEDSCLRYRKLSVVYRVICARKDRELEDARASVGSYTRLLASTFQKLKDAKLCINEREFTCGKLALMNADALKSRDAIQMKLHDAIVERGRAVADKNMVEAVLRVEREEHAKTQAAFKLVRTRLCAIVIDAGGEVVRK